MAILLSKHRSQNYKRKSGGIGIYVRDNISKHVQIIDGKSEYIFWLQINKQLLGYDENVIIGAIYLPPENSRFINEDDLNYFENEIISMCSKYKYVCLAGDVNARTSQLPDYIQSDPFLNDIFDVDQEMQAHFDKYTLLEKMNIPLPRSSKDKKTNTHGMRIIELCRNNLFIMNGRFGSDANHGKLTFRDKSLIVMSLFLLNCHNTLVLLKSWTQTHFSLMVTALLNSHLKR